MERMECERCQLRFGEVAHELRSPLAAIRIGVDLARRDAAKTAEALAGIDAMVKELDRVVDELLDLSRAQLVPSPEKAIANLADICRAAIEDASLRHHGRAVVLQGHEQPLGPWDGERLRRAIRNLIDNALQHGDPGAVVEVTLTDLGDRALVAVANRGPRIPDSVRAHLFEPFRRGAASFGGLGLGLYIVKRIVEAHGGSIQVTSGDGRTVFAISLPKD